MRLAALVLLMLPPSPRADQPEPFTQHPPTCQADLLLDVRLPPSVELPELTAAMAPLEQPWILLARPAQLEGWDAELAALEAVGAEAGLWLPWPKEPDPSRAGSPTASWGRLRADRRSLRRATGQPARAAGSSSLSRQLEGSLEVFGFTLLLPAPDGLVQPPRRSIDLQGLQGSGVVLWPVQPSTRDGALGDGAAMAALLDRTAAALGAGEHPVVRLSLPAPLALRHSALLHSWHATVLAPCGAELLSREKAEDAVLAWLRAGERPSGLLGLLGAPASQPSTEEDPAPSGRVVDAPEIEAVAHALACTPGATLPRRLGPDGDLTLTQAWQALSMALQDQEPPLPLHPLLPPQSSPRSVLGPDGASIPASEITQAVALLAPGPGQQVPSFARVGGYALTGAELLCAMAAAVAGQDPVRVSPTYSPDPYAPGLGWD